MLNELTECEIKEIWDTKLNVSYYQRVRFISERLTVEQYAYFLVRSNIELYKLPLYLTQKNHNINRRTLPLIKYTLDNYLIDNNLVFLNKFKKNRIYLPFDDGFMHSKGWVYYNGFWSDKLPTIENFIKICHRLTTLFKFLNAVMTIYDDDLKPIVSAWLKNGKIHYTTPVEPSNIFTDPLPDIFNRDEYEQLWGGNIKKLSPVLQKYVLIELARLLCECGAITKISLQNINSSYSDSPSCY